MSAKMRFEFDSRRLLEAVSKANITSLRRAGAYVRKAARNAVHKSKRASETKSQASAQRKAELASINDEWDRANASADEAQTQEILEHQKAYQDALTGAAEEIASARAAWQDAMEEVKRKAAEKAEKVEEIRERTETAAEETERSEVRIQEISTAGEKSMGAWNSETLDALLGGGAQERTAKATEQMAKNTLQTNKLLKKIGQDKALTYG